MSAHAGFLKGVADGWFSPNDDNADWPKRRLHTHLWSGQQRIRDSVRRNRRTAVQSAHDLGKSFISASLACEWIDTHEPGEAFVVTTAPTAPQVTAIIWREIEKMYRKGGLPGRINMGRIPEWVIGKEIVGYGRKPSDYDDTGFQGIHAKYVLVIVDEAYGIPERLWTAIDALLTNQYARVVAIGNPDDPNCYFRTICMPGSGWNVIKLDGLLSPNFTEDNVKANSKKSTDAGVTGDLYNYMVDNDIPFATEEIPFDLQENLLSPLWVAERMGAWNIEKLDDGKWTSSPLWEARVRGVFPTSGSDGVIPLHWILAAVARGKELDESGLPKYKLIGRRVFGVDVAREGRDATCVSERIGPVVLKVDREGWGTDTMTVANRTHEKMEEDPEATAVVDVVGVGGGVVDRLRELKHDVHAFNGSTRTEMRTKDNEFGFSNQRSASWWNMRELLNPKDSLVVFPDDEYLIADLAAPKWRVAVGAKIVVEEKAETKKRLKRSPDTGDSVVMSFWHSGIGSADWSAILNYGGSSSAVVPYGNTDSHTVGTSIFEDVLSGYTVGQWA